MDFLRRRGFIWGALAALFVVLAGFFFLGSPESKIPESEAETEAAIVVTVLRDGVYLLKDSERIKLLSGTQVREGATIETNATGRASLKFPSGSIARLDSETTITIESQFFDERSGVAQTSIFLSIGKVWSRVAKLATPASSWEVKTSNVVAAVRGTAFQVGFTEDKKSRVFVSENKVRVQAVDPVKKEVVDEKDLDENGFAELALEETRKGKKITLVAAPKEVTEDPWVRENRNLDEAAKTEIETREREAEKKFQNFKEELREEKRTLEEYLEEIKELRSEFRIGTIRAEGEAEKQEEGLFQRLFRRETEKPAIDETPVTRSTESTLETLEEKTPEIIELRKAPETNLPSGGGTGSAGAIATTQKITGFSIEPFERASAYLEGSLVKFTPFAEFEGGREARSPREVVWSIEGPIGSIGPDGVLSAKITDEVTAEFGKAEGSVVGRLKLPDGTLLTSKPYPVIILAPQGDSDVSGDQG